MRWSTRVLVTWFTYSLLILTCALQWRHNGRDSVSSHQPHDCLLNRLFRSRSQKTSKLRVTGIREGNSPVTGEFAAQMASNAENVSIWWRHHGKGSTCTHLLTHGDLLTHICVSKIGRLWFKQCLVGCCVKNHYPAQLWLIFNWTHGNLIATKFG